jgi:dTDP-4-amino-4,6-dideoxygalactose transaminase
VFVDIRPDTLNLDEKLLEAAITPRTKAIIVVHYAGVACDMDVIREIASKHGLMVFEDAAQAYLSKYKNRYLGTLGDLGSLSFHETKNVISGEGGALIINSSLFSERAEIIREKGTNRSRFLRGEIDKYSWVDVGSSYLPGEIIAAFLLAQLEKAEELKKRRLAIWNRYNTHLEPLEKIGLVRRPVIPSWAEHNGHIYYLLLGSLAEREKIIDYLKRNRIMAIFHYVPLHSSPAGKKYGRSVGNMKLTNKAADTIIRLPLFFNLARHLQDYIVDKVYNFFRESLRKT